MQIRYVKGTNLSVKVAMLDSTGVPFDLTGATLYLTVKSKETDTVASFTITGTAAVPTNGVAVFALLPASASALTPGQFRYDIQIVQGGATYVVVPNAPFELVPSIR